MDSEVPESRGQTSQPDAAHERLESWKEIAGYLKRDVRTVQRWEQRKNLPVHRLPGKHGAAVYAWKSELETWRKGETPDSPGRTRRIVMTFVSAAFLAGVAIAVWLVRREAPAEYASRTPKLLTSYLGDEQYPSFSPDGTHIAFASDGPDRDNFDIYVKKLGTDEAVRFSKDPAYETSPAWSPDGRSIAFLRQLSNGMEAVVVIPAAGGPERRISESYHSPPDPAGPFLAWTPDSRWLVVARRPTLSAPYQLDLVSLENQRDHRLTVPPAHSWGDTGPTISPDGKTLVFSRTISVGVGELLLLHLSGDPDVMGVPQRIPSASTYPSSPVWINDKEIVFC